MKKFKMIVVAALALFTVQHAMAEVDCGFWFNAPESITNASIEGVRFGVPLSVSNGKVEGAELALCYSGTKHVEGIKYTLIGVNRSETLKGGELAFLNIVDQKLNGLQWGFINHSEKDGVQVGFINNCNDDAIFQLGLLNINKNGWLPVMIFVNFSGEIFD